MAANLQGKTINELFPDNLGRLKFIRVMLMLKDGRLAKFPKDKVLPDDLRKKIVEAMSKDARR